MCCPNIWGIGYRITPARQYRPLWGFSINTQTLAFTYREVHGILLHFNVDLLGSWQLGWVDGHCSLAGLAQVQDKVSGLLDVQVDLGPSRQLQHTRYWGLVGFSEGLGERPDECTFDQHTLQVQSSITTTTKHTDHANAINVCALAAGRLRVHVCMHTH